MNNEELIAEYWAGGDVGDELLKRCRKDPELLAELSELVAVDRLLKIPSSQDDEAYFVDEVSHLLQKEEANVKSQDDDEAFAFGVIESIQPKQGQGSNSMWAWGGIAAAALVAIGLWLGIGGQVVDSSNTISNLGKFWGKVTDVSWAVVVNGTPRHASQLYEAALEGLLLFVILWTFNLKERPRMASTGLFLLCYGVFRFGVEFVRLPDAHIGYMAWGWFTRGQLLTIPMIIGGITLILLAYRNSAVAKA